MSEEISSELFTHLVELAAFELPQEEAEYLHKQLNNQLKSIHELEAIPLDDKTPITSHGVPFTPAISPPIRSDQWQPSEYSGDILSQAPETDEGYFIVPEIPHTDLE